MYICRVDLLALPSQVEFYLCLQIMALSTLPVDCCLCYFLVRPFRLEVLIIQKSGHQGGTLGTA
ncbi:hypothetical protein RND71_003383 [Anisodus tanguticus]|uniref:Uncharacterized protein n=1 Tax=Anisodus tanguticus TaxID=243964 RepID=A0AAE1SXT4_9SOLA|nr:hypothetical protein RND71_003383 [Anisodus tanguticus]